MSAGEGGGGAPAAASDALVLALAEIRRDGDWARLSREFGALQITPTSLSSLLEISQSAAASLMPELQAVNADVVGALLTASADISKDPTSGDYSAKGRLARVRVLGALDQIAALRDRVKG